MLVTYMKGKTKKINIKLIWINYDYGMYIIHDGNYRL